MGFFISKYIPYLLRYTAIPCRSNVTPADKHPGLPILFSGKSEKTPGAVLLPMGCIPNIRRKREGSFPSWRTPPCRILCAALHLLAPQHQKARARNTDTGLILLHKTAEGSPLAGQDFCSPSIDSSLLDISSIDAGSFLRITALACLMVSSSLFRSSLSMDFRTSAERNSSVSRRSFA